MSSYNNQDAYIDLRDIIAERTSSVVAWIGSGLSIQADLPGWNGLKSSLEQKLQNKAESIRKEEKGQLFGQLKNCQTAKSNWQSFSILRKALGKSSFRSMIREEFKNASSVEIPEVYNLLWHLGITGLLNLNIDRLATRSFHNVYNDKLVIEFCGQEISQFVHLLNGPEKFIANLHGIHEKFDSWVFTSAQLDDLFNNKGYQTFIKSCLTSKIVLFLGISADDVAVGGHLQQLKNDNIDFGNHFWITSRDDLATDEWAEEIGIRVIRYSNSNNHRELLHLLKDIQSFIPKDDFIYPLPPPAQKSEPTTLPSPKEILKSNSNEIRKLLNNRAREILTDQIGNHNQYEKYREFCEKYDEAIYRAWYANVNPGANEFFDYKLEELHAKGAFGKVYRAIDNNDNIVAIKILQEEERKKDDFFQSFRRGVRSMRILASRNVKGMVRYIEAYEIPAFVVMDWIDGINLKEAVEAHKINDWYSVLQIAGDLASILENAHRLPERVLHRDLRPPNIMLKDYYEKNSNWEVILLDFDLSWHLGASEKSVLATSAASYLAPEQIHTMKGISTRNATVDSFGIGMTMFYLIAHRNPYPVEHNHVDWEKTIIEASNNFECKEWKSIPRRFSRLILNCTKHKQSERWDMFQIKNELIRLKQVLLNPSETEFAELIAEEIISNTDQKQSYSWDPSDLSAKVSLPSGIQLAITGHESKQQIQLLIRWEAAQVAEGKKIDKWLPKVRDQIIKHLKKAKWNITSKTKGKQSLDVVANISVRYARVNKHDLATSVNNAISALKFK